MKTLSPTLGLAVLAALAPASQAQTQYRVTDLGVLPGGSMLYATAISDSGIVVGYGNAGAAQSHAFLWQNGVISDITASSNFPSNAAAGINGSGQAVGGESHVWQGGALTSIPPAAAGESVFAGAISNAGAVAGRLGVPSGTSVYNHAFLYRTGQTTDLGTLGGYNSGAVAVNASGQVAGNSDTTKPIFLQSPSHAFLYQNGTMTDLGVLHPTTADSSTATAINGGGTVVGYAGTGQGGNNHAFLYSGGQMQDLGTIVPSASGQTGYVDSEAYGINDAGQVVGSSEFAFDNGNHHAFVYAGGQMLDLNSLAVNGSDWDLVSATAVNGQGQIVGYGFRTVNGSVVSRSFLLTPTPEPSQSAALGLGALGLVALALKSRRRCQPG